MQGVVRSFCSGVGERAFHNETSDQLRALRFERRSANDEHDLEAARLLPTDAGHSGLVYAKFTIAKKRPARITGRAILFCCERDQITR